MRKCPVWVGCPGKTASTQPGFSVGRDTMKEIPLSQGKVALVDDADYEWLSQWKWSYFDNKTAHTGYAYRLTDSGKGEFLHRMLLGASEGQDTDHINHNGLDDQRHNIRLCTRSQNNANSRKHAFCSSQYKGVTFRGQAHTGKWIAQASAGGRQRYIGIFLREEDAARAYNAFALKTWGEFARLNDV
jgi:hypothetical protein